MTSEEHQAALEKLKEVSAQHGGDLASAITRLAILAAENLRKPGTIQRDLSPLQFGEDTEQLAKQLTGEARGRRLNALEILTVYCRTHYPGFKAMPGAPGFRCYDRVRRSRHFPET